MKQKILYLNGNKLKIADIINILSETKQQVALEPAALQKAEKTFDFLSRTLEKNNKIIYGINTGFGPMANYILAHGQILDLQKNLILSHAVGMGEKIQNEFVLSATLVRLNTLAKGYSGVSKELLKQLQALINLRIIPVVPEHGAVGTSGDLVQLAHIALAILGKGRVSFKNSLEQTSKIFKQKGLKPYQLKPKEGLSLINGTSMMTGISAIVCKQARDLLSLGLRSGCLALEVVNAYDDSLSQKLHELRPHNGQVVIAKAARQILKDSKLIRNREELHKNANLGKKVIKINESVQEIYSLRCMSQVLGPVYDTLARAWQTTEIEMNAVTDNPIADSENEKFLHGGNFHGDYIAVSLDQLKAGLVKLTMLSERRLNFFLNHKANQAFPPFLNLDTPGLTLALQGLQFVATSTTANSQTLGYPMNLHSIPTNGDNQDIVSMGTDAALMAAKVADNAFVVLAIEALSLCQAVDYLKIYPRLSKNSRQLYDFVRGQVAKIEEDRHIQPELQAFLAKLKTWPELNLFEGF